MGGGEIMTEEQKQRTLGILKELNGSNALTNFMQAERCFLGALKLDADAQTQLEKLIQETLGGGQLKQPIDPKWGDNLAKVTRVICRSAKAKEVDVNHRTLFRKATAVTGGLLSAGANSAVGAMFLPALPFTVWSVKAGCAVSAAAALSILNDFYQK